jgi:hypothetical protein
MGKGQKPKRKCKKNAGMEWPAWAFEKVKRVIIVKEVK